VLCIHFLKYSFSTHNAGCQPNSQCGLYTYQQQQRKEQSTLRNTAWKWLLNGRSSTTPIQTRDSRAVTLDRQSSESESVHLLEFCKHYVTICCTPLVQYSQRSLSVWRLKAIV
jgi:hypothetical protein